MKIKVTEIRATADELKCSNSLADGFSSMIRSVFSDVNKNEYYKNDPEDFDQEEEI